MMIKVCSFIHRMYQDKLASLKRQLQQLQEGNFWVVFFAPELPTGMGTFAGMSVMSFSLNVYVVMIDPLIYCVKCLPSQRPLWLQMF